MSEYIPFEMQREIIKRLPVKSLLQFRSVSKPWKTLIDSSEFNSDFKVRQTHPHRLLVWYKDVADNKEKYVRFVDDDDDEAFSQQELAPTAPLLSKFVSDLKMVGSSQGLLCFYGYYQDPGNPLFKNATKMAVVWNPSIRKSVCIPVPDLSETVVGFGVCSITGDPTIVKIRNVSMHNEMEDSSPRVEVFTLSRGVWTVPSSILPKKVIQVTWSQVAIDSHIYWVAFDTDAAMYDEFTALPRKSLIVSFDMTTQEFRVIDLPKGVAYQFLDRATLSVSKIGDSLAVVKCIKYTDYITDMETRECHVCIMDRTNLLTKLFFIEKQCDSLKILGFTKRGEPIMETQDDYEEPAALVVYEPTSKRINDTGIYGKDGSLFVSSYMETLLLLDHPDCSVFSFGPR